MDFLHIHLLWHNVPSFVMAFVINDNFMTDNLICYSTILIVVHVKMKISDSHFRYGDIC